METRPVYRVAAAGLDPRDVRLIEIVFKHSQYNRFAFRFEPRLDPANVDVLIVNPLETDGLRAIARVRTAGRQLPVISAVPRGATSTARHAISIDRLTLQLLPILNRVVEMELRGAGAPAGDTTAQGGASPTGHAAAAASGPGSAPASASGTVSASTSAAGPEMARPPAPPTGPTAPGSFSPAVAAARAAAATPASPAARAARTAAPASGSAQATRDFMREAARKSREGDDARAAAMQKRAESGRARVTAPAGPTSAGAASPARRGTSVATGAAPSNLVAFPRSAEPASPRVHVLVVDDSPTVRQQLSIAFGRMNIVCDAAARADEALQMLASGHYDLVLVDVVMPEMDGYKLTRQIRRRHRGTPVIILTSRSSPFDLARGALAGCNSYLVKPVPLRQLEAAVVKQLRKALAIDDLSTLIRLTPDARAAQPPRAAAPALSAEPAPTEQAAQLRGAPRSGGQA